MTEHTATSEKQQNGLPPAQTSALGKSRNMALAKKLGPPMPDGKPRGK